MSAPTRWFVLTALLALVGAALIHVLFLLGYATLWRAWTHLLLGWITAMIYAVSYHTMPVFSGRDFPSVGLIYGHWMLLTAGVSAATVGLAQSWQPAVIVGLTLELAGSLVFVANTILLFVRGSQRAARMPLPRIAEQPRIDRLGTHATKAAGLCLPLALTLLLSTQTGWLGGAWWLAAQHLITLGWVLLMIVGVAYHMLPRLSGRAVRGPIWAAAQLGGHVVALVLIVTALGVGWSTLFALGGTLMALSLGLFAWTIWPTLARIKRIERIVLEERPR